jgi:hypothetical protein
MARRLRVVWPAVVALLVSGAFAGSRLAAAGGDPLALATIGTHFQTGDPSGTLGYDGQFAYFIALHPAPEEAAPHLDVPAYRYQRILYPLLAWAAGFGNPDLIPWALLAINLAAHFAGTWALAAILDHHGRWPGFALSYGLWVGLVAGVGLDLTEPLAYALIVCAWLSRARGRVVLGSVFLGLSLFAKETGVLFWAAVLLADLLQRAPRRATISLSLAGAAFVVWQIALWRIFGRPGIGSGGELSTPFEWIPFLGFLRIGAAEPAALALFGVIFGPTILLPSIWGIVASVRQAARRDWAPEVWALLLNAGVVPFLPFSTFREPLGLVRVASGLVVATVLFGASQGRRRPLEFALAWCALLAILLNA